MTTPRRRSVADTALEVGVLPTIAHSVLCCCCLISALQPWAVQVTERAKWDAYEAQKGKSQDAAKAEYIALVEALAAADK